MTSQKIKLALLVHAGGTQTNLKAIQAAAEQGKINAEISTIVSDAEDATPILKNVSPDYICLAGWKKNYPRRVSPKVSKPDFEYPPRLNSGHNGWICFESRPD